MSIEEKVTITISISKIYRDRLRTMAAEQNFDNPNEVQNTLPLGRLSDTSGPHFYYPKFLLTSSYIMRISVPG